MKTFTTTKFTGHYPVGAAAIVLAETPEAASEKLNAELRAMGLDGDAEPEDMNEWPTEGKEVLILVDGDY